MQNVCQSDVTLEPDSALAKFIEQCTGMVHLPPTIHLYLTLSQTRRLRSGPSVRGRICIPRESEQYLVLETTPLFANIHAAAATSSQSAVPTNLDTDLHFTCFVAAPSSRGPSSEGSSMRIVELDGRRNGPIDRGECTNLLAVCPHLFMLRQFSHDHRMRPKSFESFISATLRVCIST